MSESLFLAIALLWAGMLIGVSFIATPVKFVAPGLTLQVALEVGRVTFHLFSRIEWGLALLLLLASFPGASRLRVLLAIMLVALVAAQAIWLLPALDQRVAAIVAGNAPPPSHHHWLYAAGEATKLILLVAAAGIALWHLQWRR
ncbi:MAG: hypothetical protein WD470_05520 [Rhodospirillaceae bacterium]